jgi:hypothetical protein
MADLRERRGARRVSVSGHFGARALATLEVRLVDLSITGARIEHGELLRPGSHCTFHLPPAIQSVVLSSRVVHSTVVGSTPMPDGDRQLLYQSGLAFLNVTPNQRAALEEVMKRITPGGGIGGARLTF